MDVKEIKPVEITTNQGVQPELPKTVQVELENDILVNLAVEWENVSVDKLDGKGSYEIEGTVYLKEYPKPFIEQRADPYLYKHRDGYYYFTGSYPLYDRIVLRRAKSIEELPEAEEVTVWKKHENGIMSEHIWAPEIHYIDGKWYIHFAAGDRDDVWAIRPYVLENESPNPLEGEWIEKGQINTSFQSFSLDATTFEHRGVRYLVWAQKVDNDTVSNLYISKMSSPWTLEGEQVLLSTPEYAWEQEGFYVNEGPAFINRNGKVFIAYSASATDDRYAMGLLTADENSNLLDPTSWTKSEVPVMETSEETGEYGPGHNSFSVDEEGNDLLVYHARPYKEIVGNPLYDHNRHARIQPLLWKKDGTPYFGKPGYQINDTSKKAKAIIVVK